MNVEASTSLTEAQEALVRDLVASGRYPDASAVIEDGLDLLRREAGDVASLRALLEERLAGPFEDLETGRRRTAAMIAARRAELGL